MKKRYISRNTTPHFPIGDKRVAFIPVSRGGSYYETDDEEEIEKIEAHPWFGSLFKLAGGGEAEAPARARAAVAEEDKAAAETDVLEVKHFDTLADAKNYLASEFDVVRSNVKNTATAQSIGRSHGIDIRIGGQKVDE